MLLDYASLKKLMGETMSLEMRRHSIFVSHDRLINHSNESGDGLQNSGIRGKQMQMISRG